MRKFLFPEYEIYSSDESFNITIENSLNPALATRQKYILLQIKAMMKRANYYQI